MTRRPQAYRPRDRFWAEVEYWTTLLITIILLSALVGYLSRP